MIGLMDSGNGGLTVFKTLLRRFPKRAFVYLGDHANGPYGNRASGEIVNFTRKTVEHLFGHGCRLVILGCNTATAISLKTLQQDWLPNSGWPGCNVLGIIAPTVEAATQTPWAVTKPQYPQKNTTDTIAIFATKRTIKSHVYREEISKRCPKVNIIEQACPDLAGAIEKGAKDETLNRMVASYVDEMLAKTGGETPHRVILGCTHYPLIEKIFQAHLPEKSRLLSQGEAVADSLEDYLLRHRHYSDEYERPSPPRLLTTSSEKLATNESMESRLFKTPFEQLL